VRPGRIGLGQTPWPVHGGESKPLIGRGLLVVLALVLGLLVYEARSSVSIEWAIGLVGLGILSAIALRRVLRGTTDPDPLVGPTSPGSIQDGEIAAVSQSARRASRGLRFSQVVLTSRVRAAFLERMRLALGLSSDAIRAVEADPTALRRLVRDPVLSEFLHLPTGSLEDRTGWVVRARARSGFAREFRDVLDRMEVWR
jgi:hypothetical protein